nr:hypothetical protein Iba_chr01aCG13520 [Ipomoea batatas]GMC53949.1 hypothetical protein Iba_chr01dCG11500 [Ipomoea batatas]GMC55875.1 hypothetical protein Iba_chr01fCG1790 [Ipomoea batatas]GMD51990.1 hypothetical protein Iba_scaffold47175CG0010 [Ipomoea batatas]
MPRITAPSARKRVIWLVRLNGAVSHNPGGTLSCPPPFFPSLEIAITALSNAAVFTVTPSPTPPNSVKLNANGRSLGNSLAVKPRRTDKSPSAQSLCHRNTEQKTAIQSTVRRVLCVEKKVGMQR